MVGETEDQRAIDAARKCALGLVSQLKVLVWTRCWTQEGREEAVYRRKGGS